MSANELLHLAGSVKTVLEALLATAQDDKFLMGEINQSAQHLIRQLRKLEQDEAYKSEIVIRAQVAMDGLRFIAKQSCERFEQLGGFGYKPQEVIK